MYIYIQIYQETPLYRVYMVFEYKKQTFFNISTTVFFKNYMYIYIYMYVYMYIYIIDR